MGLKSKLNKMKNFLFDDEEEESASVKKVKERKQKNKVKEEPKDSILEKTSDFGEDFYLEDLSESIENTNSIKTRSSKSEFDFKFPEFDDSDFQVSNPIIKKEEEEKVLYSYESEKPKTSLYQGGRKKDEVKKFKPSPIISPIYGLLDNDGNLIEKDSDNYKKVISTKEEITFDDVRKKAYGKIDEEIENTIKKLSNKTIEEAQREHEEKIVEEAKKEKASRTKKMKAIKEEIDDDIILPNINFKEIDVDSKKIIDKSNKKDDEDDDDDTKEQDLFNLIDTIYNGKEKDK